METIDFNNCSIDDFEHGDIVYLPSLNSYYIIVDIISDTKYEDNTKIILTDGNAIVMMDFKTKSTKEITFIDYINMNNIKQILSKYTTKYDNTIIINNVYSEIYNKECNS